MTQPTPKGNLLQGRAKHQELVTAGVSAEKQMNNKDTKGFLKDRQLLLDGCS